MQTVSNIDTNQINDYVANVATHRGMAVVQLKRRPYQPHTALRISINIQRIVLTIFWLGFERLRLVMIISHTRYIAMVLINCLR